MAFHVPNNYRVRTGQLASEDNEGNNGAFLVYLPHSRVAVNIVASDGMGWEHVSVSLEKEKRCPTWEEMCEVKDIFWDEADCVIQYHPPKSEYVNCHPYCLHLWRPTACALPGPNNILVGPSSIRSIDPFTTRGGN